MQRWNHHLRPDIKKEAWTAEEEAQLVEAHKELGNKWSDIARLLPGERVCCGRVVEAAAYLSHSCSRDLVVLVLAAAKQTFLRLTRRVLSALLGILSMFSIGRTENAVKNHWNATLRRKESSLPESAPQVLKAYMVQIGLIDNCKNSTRGPKRKRSSRDIANTDDTSSDPNWEPSVEGLEGTSGITVSAAPAVSGFTANRAKVVAGPTHRPIRCDSSNLQVADSLLAPVHSSSTSPPAATMAAPGTPAGPRNAALMAASAALPSFTAVVERQLSVVQHQNSMGLASGGIPAIQAARSRPLQPPSSIQLACPHPGPAGLPFSPRTSDTSASAAAGSCNRMGFSSPMYCQAPSSLHSATAAGGANLQVLSHHSRQDSSLSSNSRMPAHIAAGGLPHITSNVDAALIWEPSGQGVAAGAGKLDRSPEDTKPEAPSAPLLSAQHTSPVSEPPGEAAEPGTGKSAPVIGQLEAAAAAACVSAVADAQESEEIENTLMWLQTADDQVRPCVPQPCRCTCTMYVYNLKRVIPRFDVAAESWCLIISSSGFPDAARPHAAPGERSLDIQRSRKMLTTQHMRCATPPAGCIAWPG